MAERRIGIIVNGATGRMGYRQHLVRSLLAIRDQGGVEIADGDRLVPDLLLVGRNEEKLRTIAERHDLKNWTTDVDEALANPDYEVYFDALVTNLRVANLKKAISAGKAISTEQPTAESFEDALELARLAKGAGVVNGVVHDKLYLPGLLKLRRLIDSGFFGEILSIRGEFGYWVFEGDWQSAQRPSWNYRAEDGGGMVLDMFPHWHYVLEHLFGPVRTVTAKTATHIPRRWDEADQPYKATADDAAYGIFELDNGLIAQINSSWNVRVNRDELVEFQVDGTEGSAVAGLRNCRVQHRTTTPKAVWNPDLADNAGYRNQWQTVPDNTEFPNGFRAQWEAFLKHVVSGTPFPHDLLSGARGLHMAEAGLHSARTGHTVELDEVTLT